MIEVSVVIPTFRRGKILRALVVEIRNQLFKDQKKREFEIIIVNDDSPDDTEAVIAGLAQEFLEVIGVNLVQNVGQQLATLAGLRLARGSIIVTIDDDGKNLPADIPRLIQHLSQGFDLVYGLSESSDPVGFHRRIGTALKNRFLRSFCHLPDIKTFSSFRAINRTLVDRVITDQRKNIYLSASMLQWPIRVGQIQVLIHSNVQAATGYTFRKRLALFVGLLLSYGRFSAIVNRKKPTVQYQIRSQAGVRASNREGFLI